MYRLDKELKYFIDLTVATYGSEAAKFLVAPQEKLLDVSPYEAACMDFEFRKELCIDIWKRFYKIDL